MIKNILFFVGLSMSFFPLVLFSGQAVIANDFQSGAPARAADVNQNFQDVKTAIDDNDQRIQSNETAVNANAAQIQTNSNNIPDQSNIMHLTGDETVEGIKTFSGPTVFTSEGRFTRHIELPLTTGVITNPSQTANDFFVAGVQAIRFSVDGEVTFSFPVPDDIDYAIAPQIRLLWGLPGIVPTDLSASWKIDSLFLQPGMSIGSFSSVSTPYLTTTPVSGEINATQFMKLADKVSAGDTFGVIRLSLPTVVPTTDIYLLHIELEYTANRLGQSIF